LKDTGRAGLNEKLARTTMSGAEGMIQDAVTRLENSVGGSNLQGTIHALDLVADSINGIATAVKNVPHLGDGILGGGALLLLGGGILKGVAAWNTYSAAMRTAAAVGAIERAGEAAKIPIAKAEAFAVKASAQEYFMLGGELRNVNQGMVKSAAQVTENAGRFAKLQTVLKTVTVATLGENAAALTFSGTMWAGIGILGLYAVALGGVLVVGYEIYKMFQDANQASRDFEASIAAVNKAKAQGYDLTATAGQATGFNALPVWKQIGEQAVNTLSGADVFDTTDGGSSALTDAHSRALAKQHGMAPNGVRAQQIQAQQAQAQAAADAAAKARADAAAAAGDAANKYQLDPALDFKLKQDERHIALLQAQGGHEKDLKAARADEIADLKTAAGLLEQKAALATDAKAKYNLMNEAADDRQKAQLMGIEGEKDKRSKLDKAVASIFGGGGLGEGDIMKRAGIGQGFFAAMGKGKAPVNPLKAALMQIAKKPAIFNINIGDKPFAQLKTEIKDDTISSLLHLLETSNLSAALGGHH
jgi:hypothetical protein